MYRHIHHLTELIIALTYAGINLGLSQVSPHWHAVLNELWKQNMVKSRRIHFVKDKKLHK